jgi:hypothetical protein
LLALLANLLHVRVIFGAVLLIVFEGDFGTTAKYFEEEI